MQGVGQNYGTQGSNGPKPPDQPTGIIARIKAFFVNLFSSKPPPSPHSAGGPSLASSHIVSQIPVPQAAPQVWAQPVRSAQEQHTDIVRQANPAHGAYLGVLAQDRAQDRAIHLKSTQEACEQLVNYASADPNTTTPTACKQALGFAANNAERSAVQAYRQAQRATTPISRVLQGMTALVNDQQSCLNVPNQTRPQALQGCLIALDALASNPKQLSAEDQVQIMQLRDVLTQRQTGAPPPQVNAQPFN